MIVVEFIKDAVNFLTNPPIFLTLAALLLLFTIGRPAFWRPKVALALGIGGAIFLGLSMLDPDFLLIVKKPDNIPIVAMLFLVGFFMWLSLHQAHENDARIAAGQPPNEASNGEAEKTWVWPDLVYTEMLCMVIGMIVLVVWGIVFQAPIEEAANPARTPNPSKAPWYFLGLQEMLVYFDPWLAGVVLPTMIIVGLMAIPYIDTNPRGNGYYSFRERKWEIGVFLYGFLVLWSFLIITGTFLRGPNWSFYGPYEFWDPNKLEPLVNIDLSELFWVKMLSMPLPKLWLIREAPGLIVVLAYLGLPVALALGPFRRFLLKMGPARYYVGAYLFLTMMSLPIKMVLRWLFNLKYLVHIQELFLNI